MITVGKLARAIMRRLGHSPTEATEEARTVMSYFGFRDTIIDNAIDPADRKVFYVLHDAGLLKSFWETVPLLDGRNWRIFYWHLDEEDLNRLLKEAEEPPQEKLYRSLPEEAWAHTPSPA